MNDYTATGAHNFACECECEALEIGMVQFHGYWIGVWRHEERGPLNTRPFLTEEEAISGLTELVAGESAIASLLDVIDGWLEDDGLITEDEHWEAEHNLLRFVGAY